MSLLSGHQAPAWKVKLFGALRLQAGSSKVVQTSPCGLQEVEYVSGAGDDDVEDAVDWLVDCAVELDRAEDPEMVQKAQLRRVHARIAASWVRVEKARIRAAYERLSAGQSPKLGWEHVLVGMAQLKLETGQEHALSLFQSVCDKWREVDAEQFEFIIRFTGPVAAFGEAFVLEVETALRALQGHTNEKPGQRRRRRSSFADLRVLSEQASDEVRALAAQRLANIVHSGDEEQQRRRQTHIARRGALPALLFAVTTSRHAELQFWASKAMLQMVEANSEVADELTDQGGVQLLASAFGTSSPVAPKAQTGCVLILARAFEASQAARRTLLSKHSDVIAKITDIVRRAAVDPQEAYNRGYDKAYPPLVAACVDAAAVTSTDPALHVRLARSGVCEVLAHIAETHPAAAARLVAAVAVANTVGPTWPAWASVATQEHIIGEIAEALERGQHASSDGYKKIAKECMAVARLAGSSLNQAKLRARGVPQILETMLGHAELRARQQAARAARLAAEAGGAALAGAEPPRGGRARCTLRAGRRRRDSRVPRAPPQCRRARLHHGGCAAHARLQTRAPDRLRATHDLSLTLGALRRRRRPEARCVRLTTLDPAVLRARHRLPEAGRRRSGRIRRGGRRVTRVPSS